jgi:hypothetical protein
MKRPAVRPSLRRVCAGVALVQFAGCTAPLMTSYLSGSRRVEAEAPAVASDTAYDPSDPKAIALRKALGEEPASPEVALAGVLDELEAIRAIDPAAQQEVMADLKAAKPEHYQYIVGQYKAALAYRQQFAQRRLRDDSPLASAQSEPTYRPPTTPASTPTPRSIPSLEQQRATAARIAALTTPAPTATVLAPPRDSTSPFSTASLQMPGVPPLTPATALAAGGFDPQLQQASLHQAMSPQGPLHQAMSPPAALIAPPPVAGDWQNQLNAAIAELQRTVSPQPASIAEVHEHFRLRTMLLLAGRQEEAFLPIPGASPAQQEYWSKQLFAMSAYLNSGGQLDDKRRAAAALVHLDDARASLAELATLQVRNLVIVSEIDGFGAYTPVADPKFKPEAHVGLYAEVECFTSAATSDGHKTQLSTSYRVVDASGRQIDAKPFPDILDVCRSRRRDLNVEYGLYLPTHISPGMYQVELTVTDLQSGKIAQSAVPLEVIGTTL